MENTFFDFFNWLAGQLWGWPMLALITACGIVFSLGTGFFQIRHLPFIFRETLGKVVRREKLPGEGTITPFQAISAALAGTIGNGNIAGVATAIALGGPGAVFWMWVMAILGMMTKFVEVTLAVLYREQRPDGTFYGGPMHYIEKGLGAKWKPLSIFYGIMMILGALGTAVWVQPSTMATALETTFKIKPLYTVVASVALTALVVFGGFKRIGRFAEKVTPFLVIFYVFFSLGVILVNITHLPRVFIDIFQYAFNPHAAIGGFAGATVIQTLQRGASRGTFSNEAGLGTAPMVHATAITDHPCNQGLYGAMEVFIDTMVMCTMTAIVILCAAPDLWHNGQTGVELTFSGFQTLYGGFGQGIVAIAVTLAALTTMIGYYFEYKTSVVYVFGDKPATIFLFNVIWLIPPFIVLEKSVDFVWTVVDVSTGIEGIPNMIALLLLSPAFFKTYKAWLKDRGL
ncbi:MAG: sodium:alanine symporter family protein [Synergistaceae bacterium]|jgi:AGCS family alanine or glycine:cation symporter|nr:sodium:alanine symporter family protein [Synergistaceae bacterium]